MEQGREEQNVITKLANQLGILEEDIRQRLPGVVSVNEGQPGCQELAQRLESLEVGDADQKQRLKRLEVAEESRKQDQVILQHRVADVENQQAETKKTLTTIQNAYQAVQETAK